VALAFAGVSAKEDVARVKALHDAMGDAWPSAWLQTKGIQS
jgi:type IV secretion system protein VirB4